MEAERSLPSYYKVLEVEADASIQDIKRAYRKLAMQWHPDRWTRTPSLSGDAKRKFQQIQEAYAVLSDQRKRRLYDVGLYDPEDEDDEGFSDFMEEMISLMAQTREEAKACSLGELQNMLWEMAQGFESPSSSWYCGAIEDGGGGGGSKRTKWDPNGMRDRHTGLGVTGFNLYQTRSY